MNTAVRTMYCMRCVGRPAMQPKLAAIVQYHDPSDADDAVLAFTCPACNHTIHRYERYT